MAAVNNYITETWRMVLSTVQTVTFLDIIDILVVAYLIYRILTVVQKTSASSVIKGIVLLMIVVWLSSLLKLNVLSFLLDQTMKMGVVIVIILFQPEFRKFLEQIGSRDLRTLVGMRGREENDEATIINTANACFELSKTRTGALIVFEREIGLADYSSSGTHMDSSLSVELLKQIFYPNTPLHDGAVIVKNSRITAAGCMLPMSSSTNISKELGMRHRAAIGISERSDAVAVIVSEETGHVSAAVDGMIKRHLTREILERLLRTEVMNAAEKKAKNKKTV